jgi:hypothetical protein
MCRYWRDPATKCVRLSKAGGYGLPPGRFMRLFIALGITALCAVGSTPAIELVYPPDSNVINLTLPPYSLDPTGVADCDPRSARSRNGRARGKLFFAQHTSRSTEPF